jgi:uncharacterized cupredoxin-like copper-binding protein
MEVKTHRRVLLGAFAVVAVSAGVGSQALAASSVKVTLDEFKVAPSPKSASAGKVTFSVKNSGDDEHELVVIKTTTPASKLKVSGGRASTKGQVAEVEDIASGKTKKLTATLKKGHYVLICNLPGHYSGGMRADFTVK